MTSGWRIQTWVATIKQQNFRIKKLPTTALPKKESYENNIDLYTYKLFCKFRSRLVLCTHWSPLCPAALL